MYGGYDSIYRNATYNQDITTERGLNCLTDLVRIGTDDLDVAAELVALIIGGAVMEKDEESKVYTNFGEWS